MQEVYNISHKWQNNILTIIVLYIFSNVFFLSYLNNNIFRPRDILTTDEKCFFSMLIKTKRYTYDLCTIVETSEINFPELIYETVS